MPRLLNGIFYGVISNCIVVDKLQSPDKLCF